MLLGWEKQQMHTEFLNGNLNHIILDLNIFLKTTIWNNTLNLYYLLKTHFTHIWNIKQMLC